MDKTLPNILQKSKSGCGAFLIDVASVMNNG